MQRRVCVDVEGPWTFLWLEVYGLIVCTCGCHVLSIPFCEHGAAVLCNQQNCMRRLIILQDMRTLKVVEHSMDAIKRLVLSSSALNARDKLL